MTVGSGRMRRACGAPRWFIGLFGSAVISGCDVRAPSSAAAEARPRPWLTDITAECGLNFAQECGAGAELHLPQIMGAGAGAALLDADGDGRLDIYLVNGRYTGEAQAPGDDGYGMGVAVGDIDNDGDLR